MASGMNMKKISKGQKIFKIFVFLLCISLVVFLGIKFLTLLKKVEIKQLNKDIVAKESLLQEYESFTGYNKFIAIKTLEDKNSGMYWFERIEKISEIFEQLKNVDSEDTIQLSDFNVSLEELSLKGIVPYLKDLYYSSASGKMKSLIDSFESLSFIDNMSINTYQRVGDGEGFEFFLHAKVVNDGK